MNITKSSRNVEGTPRINIIARWFLLRSTRKGLPVDTMQTLSILSIPMPGNCICSQTTPWIAIFLLVAGLNDNTISSQFHTIYSQKRKTTRRADIQTCHNHNSTRPGDHSQRELIKLAQLVLQPSPTTSLGDSTFSCGSCWNLKHASGTEMLQWGLSRSWLFLNLRLYDYQVPEVSPWDDFETSCRMYFYNLMIKIGSSARNPARCYTNV